MDSNDEIEIDIVEQARRAKAEAKNATPQVSGNMRGGRGAGSSGARVTGGGVARSGLFARFQRYFDVDTADVVKRARMGLNVFSNEPFLVNGTLDEEPGTISGGKWPDLWGPFWLYQTVVFALFFSATVAGMLFAVSNGQRYEHTMELLSRVAFIFFFSTFVVPAGLWLLIQFFNLMPTLTLAQTLCLYGYSTPVWVPVSLVMGSPQILPLVGRPVVALIVRSVLAAVGFGVSFKFVGTNLWHVLFNYASESLTINKSRATVIMAAAFLCHAALACLLVSTFSMAIKSSS